MDSGEKVPHTIVSFDDDILQIPEWLLLFCLYWLKENQNLEHEAYPIEKIEYFKDDGTNMKLGSLWQEDHDIIIQQKYQRLCQ